MLLCCHDIIFVSSMFYLSLKHISFFLFLEKTIVMTTWSDRTTSGRQKYVQLTIRALHASAWLCLRVHGTINIVV